MGTKATIILMPTNQIPKYGNFWYLIRCQIAKNTSVSHGEYFAYFIAEQIQSGRYDSASEVVCAECGLKANKATLPTKTMNHLLRNWMKAVNESFCDEPKSYGRLKSYSYLYGTMLGETAARN